MPTTITKVIATDGSGDYTSLAAWFAGCPANLMTADEIWDGQCKNVGEFTAAGAVLTMSGVTTSATQYIILECVSGSSFKDNANVRTNALNYNASNGVGIRTTGNYSNAITITSENFVRLIGLQVRAIKDFAVSFSGTGCTVTDCIFSTTGTGTSAAPFSGPTFQGTVTNSLFVAASNPSGGTLIVGRNGSTGSTVIGCTVITGGASPNIQLGNYATHVLIDCCGFGGNQFVNTTTSAGSSSNNATDQATGFGTSNQTSLTFASQFISSTTDFRASATGSLPNNGVTNSNILTDISGTTRSLTTPTIGCWEIVVTGIAFDAASNSGYQTLVSSLSWAHIWTGTNRMLSIDVELLSVNDTVTAMTYGGATCTLVGTQNVVGGTGRVECWRICQNDPSAPAAGSNTIAVTISGSVACAGTAVSYTNVNQTTPTEAFAGNSGINTGTSTNATVAVTTITNNDWVHAALATNQSSGIAASQTSRNVVSGAAGTGANSDTGPITPAATQTMTFTGEGITAAWAIAGYGIIPFGSAVTPILQDLQHSPTYRTILAM